MVSDDDDDEVRTLVAQLDREARAGQTVEKVAASWRFSNISSVAEVNAWLRVGVFDGHRAGLLKLANIRPEQLAALPHDAGRLAGQAFSIGDMSVADVQSLLRSFGTQTALDGEAAVTLVRLRTLGARRPGHEGSGGSGETG